MKTAKARKQVGWAGTTYTQAFRGANETVVCPFCTAHLDPKQVTTDSVIGYHILARCYMCSGSLYYVAH